MSNFKTFGNVSQGNPGTAPNHFIASTADSYGTVTVAGYLNDQSHIMKNGDYVWLNYADTTVLPAQITATPGLFQVVYSAPNLSLVLLSTSASLVGATNYVDVTVGQAGLAAAGHVSLIPAITGAQFKIRNMSLNRGGTNFSGGGGDRLLAITDGTTVYSVIPATNLQTLLNAGWGMSTPLPFPASAAINTSTAVSTALYAAYSGGTTDYTAGSLVLSIQYERVV